MEAFSQRGYPNQELHFFSDNSALEEALIGRED